MMYQCTLSRSELNIHVEQHSSLGPGCTVYVLPASDPVSAIYESIEERYVTWNVLLDSFDPHFFSFYVQMLQSLVLLLQFFGYVVEQGIAFESTKYAYVIPSVWPCERYVYAKYGRLLLWGCLDVNNDV